MTATTDRSGLPYDTLSTPQQMRADCEAVSHNLRLPLERAARAAVAPPPSIRYEDFPSEVAKREIRIDEAAAQLATSLHFHLD